MIHFILLYRFYSYFSILISLNDENVDRKDTQKQLLNFHFSHEGAASLKQKKFIHFSFLKKII